eukprot:6525122-Ditylum_brightwellii.AAC.1
MVWNRNGQNPSGSTTEKSKALALIKLSPADFPSFTGKIVGEEDYKTKAEAHIRQTSFTFLLSHDAWEDEEKEQDEKLFNVFKNSFYDRKAYNVITSSLKDLAGNDIAPSRHAIWKNLLAWCNSGGRKNTLIYPH